MPSIRPSFHALLAGGTAIAALAAFAMIGTNDNGNADSNVDTVDGAQAYGDDFRLACGKGADAGVLFAGTIGVGPDVATTNATAVGFGATTTDANQVTLGGTGSSVRIGDINASNGAQTGTEYVVTVDGNGTLGKQEVSLAFASAARAAVSSLAVTDAQFDALAGRVGGLEGRVDTLFDLAEHNRRDIYEANEGVAMALAMESPVIPAGASFALSGGVGHFKGRTSLAMAVSAAVGEMSSLSAGVGVGARSGNVGARAGFQVAW